MKVAYVGNFQPPYSTENDVRKAWEHLGHEVIKLQENTVSVGDISVAMLEADLLLITSTWDTALPLNEMIELFKILARGGKPSVTLHLDTFWGTSRGGRKWWLNPMFHTAYIFTADGDYQEQWKLFGKNHIWLPPAVRHDAVYNGTPRAEYACDVAFVGSNGVGYHEDVWSYRKELLHNLRVMCKANNWTFMNPGGDHAKIDRGNDMNDFYASAKVTVGDSLCLKREESHYWSDRVPEATGRGGVLLMPRLDSLADIYGDDFLMYDWGDFDHLEGRIMRLLLDSEERTQMAANSQKITAKEHTYVNRVQTIIEEVSK